MRFTIYLFILISSLSSFYILISEVKSGIKEEEILTEMVFVPAGEFIMGNDGGLHKKRNAAE